MKITIEEKIAKWQLKFNKAKEEGEEGKVKLIQEILNDLKALNETREKD